MHALELQEELINLPSTADVSKKQKHLLQMYYLCLCLYREWKTEESSYSCQ